jgi:hypothetical protein
MPELRTFLEFFLHAVMQAKLLEDLESGVTSADIKLRGTQKRMKVGCSKA